MFTTKGNPQAKVQAEDQRAADLTNNLNTLLRATASNYNNSDNFYSEYTHFLAELSGTFQSLKNYAANSASSHTQAQEQARNRAAEFSKNTEEINSAIQARRNELATLQDQAREITGKFQPKLFAKLKVKETPALNELFTNLFQVYYPEQNLDWAAFKKTEVEKAKLAEFNNRLINADYTTVAVERVEALDFLRNNQDLATIAAKKDGAQVTELINFLGLVRTTSDAQRDIAQLQAKVEALRTEFEAAEKASVAANQTADKRNQFLSALNERMTQSAAPFAHIEKTTAEMKQAHEEHKRHLRNQIQQAEAQLRSVPESVYTASA